MTLTDQLLESIKGIYTGLDVRIVEITHHCAHEDVSVEGNFYYLTFRDGEPTVAEFAEYIYHRIIPYCIPRSVRSEKDEKYSSTGDPRYLHELTDQAKNLFAKAKKTQAKSGEPGEVILFMLLEAVLHAPQIACKMYLKTSEEMPVHGADSVHLGLGASSETIRLFWGESKLFETVSSAFDKIVESIGTFVASKSGRSPKDRDLDIVRDHMDIDGPLREALLKYFDPYHKESLQVEEVFACFVGFDYWPGALGKGPGNKNIEEEFRMGYSERVSTACELFVEKIKHSGLKHLRFHVFLLPFPSVKEFRKMFFNNLGVSDVD
jgi:hypothetical protein